MEGTYRCECNVGYVSGPDGKFCQQFKTDPICGTGWMFDNNAEPELTGCWAYDKTRGICDLLNPACRVFQCSKNKMTGLVLESLRIAQSLCLEYFQTETSF